VEFLCVRNFIALFQLFPCLINRVL
jgi:hypothetical protein